MAKYWCANFDFGLCLEHGIRNNFWMMQYQYADKYGNEFQGGKQKAATTKIWKRMKEIKTGDWLVAYLPKNKFFAFGKVILPRKRKAPGSVYDTVDAYLERRDSHRYKTGYVFYGDAPVFYENFSGKWRPPYDKLARYAQRIDVDEWQDFVPDGVEVEILGKVPPNEIQMAVFEIDKGVSKIRQALTGNQITTELPEEVEGDERSKKYVEGAVKTIIVNAYERSSKAKARCLAHYGWQCAVCGLAMEDLYGELGERVIHVHHLRELSSVGKQYQVDPIEDLRPVCPNCHAILHTRKPAHSIEELRRALAIRKPMKWPNKSL